MTNSRLTKARKYFHRKASVGEAPKGIRLIINEVERLRKELDALKASIPCSVCCACRRALVLEPDAFLCKECAELEQLSQLRGAHDV